MNESTANLTASLRDPGVQQPDPQRQNTLNARRRPNLDLNLLRAYGREVLDWVATDEDLDGLSLVVPSQTPPEGSSASPAPTAFTKLTLELPQLLKLIFEMDSARFPNRDLTPPAT